MMWATDKLMTIKVLIFFIVCILAIIEKLCSNRILLEKKVILWFCIYLMVNYISMAISLLNNNPGAIDYVRVELIEPILFSIIIFSISYKDFNVIKKQMLFTSVFLSLYLIVGFCSINGFLPITLPYIQKDYGGVLPFGFYKGYAEFIQWLYFLYPAGVALFFFRNKIQNKNFKRIASINFVLIICNNLIILKTAMIIVTASSILICEALLFVYRRQIKLRVTSKEIFLFFALVIVFLIGIRTRMGQKACELIIEKVRISFRVNEYINKFGVVDSGASKRILQIRALLEKWAERPFLGWGIGADASYLRSSKVHGAYEMVYFAKLMQKGLFGLSIFFLQIIWMIKQLYINCKKNVLFIESIYIMVGLIGMLIANGTNPYLDSFDKLIIVFLPLVCIRLRNSTDIEGAIK